jgi:cytochrome c553
MEYRSLVSLGLLFVGSALFCDTRADDPQRAARELESALHLAPDLENGRKVYRICQVCHRPEGWGSVSGYFPQIAGQIRTVIIKQLADIRARNRDNPTMLPFTKLELLSLQDIADVSAYIAKLPMTRNNGTGVGAEVEHGKALYEEHCAECHGERAEGSVDDHIPALHGQHYLYLVRQFRWIRDGRRRNGDRKMIKMAQNFSHRDIAAVMDYISRLKPPDERLAPENRINPDYPAYQE